MFPKLEKLYLAVLLVPRLSINASWQPLSSVPVTWHCCPIRTAISNKPKAI
ncbi:UNVERIFIED_CONTAM: hypothetical protein GTU68_027120 [Idotea baltica]|nr:hypothetical protein [Idotea baltica]